MTTVYTPSDAWPSQFVTATDDDDPSAAIFALVTDEPTADALTYLKNRGAYVESAESYGTAIAAEDVAVGPTDSAGNWQDFPSGSGVTPHVNINSCVVGDKIEIFFRGDMGSSGTGNHGDVRLAAVQNYAGGSTVEIPGTTAQKLMNYAEDGGLIDRVALSAVVTITTAGTCRVKLQGRNSDPGKVGVLGSRDYYLRAVRHRKTAA